MEQAEAGRVRTRPGPGGGTGRRAAFRMLCPYGRGGSSPLQGTVGLTPSFIWPAWDAFTGDGKVL